MQNKLLVPRGDLANQNPLVLDMSKIYSAENRLEDVKSCTPDTSSEFMGDLNVASNETSKYMAWVQYELLMAKKNYDRRKAVLILDFFPDFVKEKGVKPNEDLREAFIINDSEAYQLRDRIDCLTAALYLLENKLKCFVRGFNAAKSVAESRRFSAVAPITSPGKTPWQQMLGANNPELEIEDSE